MVLPGLSHQENQLPLSSAPCTWPFPVSTADRGSTLWKRLSSRSGASSIGRHSRWTGAGAHLPYGGRPDQLVGSGSQPVLLALRRHPQVIGPPLGNRLTEQPAFDAFGHGGAVNASGFRRENDDQQVRCCAGRTGRSAAGRAEDTVRRQW